jgi:excisionase family DNA binding protein
VDKLLTVEEAAQRFNTGVRFVRRLIAERRITVVHLGRLVRLPESAVVAFIEAGTVLPVVVEAAPTGRHLRMVG